MNLKKPALYLLLCILTVGCAPKKLTGVYYYKSAFVIHKLELKPDRTFFYEITGDVGKPVITGGTWSSNSGILNLKSYDSLDKITLIEIDSVKFARPVLSIESTIRVDFSDEYVTFNDDSIKYYFQDNQIVIPPDLIGFKKLCLHLFEMNECKIRSDSNKNFFKVIYNNKDTQPTWYIHEKWEFIHGGLCKDKSLFLKKEN